MHLKLSILFFVKNKRAYSRYQVDFSANYVMGRSKRVADTFYLRGQSVDPAVIWGESG